MNNNDIVFDFAKRYTPGGTQTLSKGPTRYVNGVYPKLIESGTGCIVKDLDGKSYIDYIAALGPIILGYRWNSVDEAVKDQLKDGYIFSLPHPLEGEVAFLLSKLVAYESMWKFTKTGSDACSMAVKIARAYTNRNNVVVCGYHGWHDWYSIVNDKKLGIPSEVAKYVTKVPYNEFESIASAVNENTACVIMEPQIFTTPKEGFLEYVKSVCKANATLLIFDETVTGFRYPKLLAQRYYDIEPDLTVLGKALGNGVPMAAVGGKREVMKICEHDQFFASTTFGGDCLGLAAAKAVLAEMPRFVDRMVEAGVSLASSFNEAFDGTVTCTGFPTRTMFNFPSTVHKALFWQECCKQGVLFGYSNFIMASHLEEPIMENTCEIVRKAAKTVLKYWKSPVSKLDGDLPVEVFRLLRR